MIAHCSLLIAQLLIAHCSHLLFIIYHLSFLIHNHFILLLLTLLYTLRSSDQNSWLGYLAENPTVFRLPTTYICQAYLLLLELYYQVILLPFLLLSFSFLFFSTKLYFDQKI